MARVMTLARQLELLFEYGRARGLPVTYRAIAEATGETAYLLRKLYIGENTNPGLRTIAAIARYFGVGLDYFQCSTRKQCKDFLGGDGPGRHKDAITRQAADLSEEGVATVLSMIDYVRRAERLPVIRE